MSAYHYPVYGLSHLYGRQYSVLGDEGIPNVRYVYDAQLYIIKDIFIRGGMHLAVRIGKGGAERLHVILERIVRHTRRFEYAVEGLLHRIQQYGITRYLIGHAGMVLSPYCYCTGYIARRILVENIRGAEAVQLFAVEVFLLLYRTPRGVDLTPGFLHSCQFVDIIFGYTRERPEIFGFVCGIGIKYPFAPVR